MNRTGWILYGALILLAVFVSFLIGAKPKPADLPGVCIYSVSVNQLINAVSIAWTSQPCQELDVTVEDEYALMQHSQFRASCPVWSVQTWTNVYLPVVDYHESCIFDSNNFDAKVVSDHAIIEAP